MFSLLKAAFMSIRWMRPRILRISRDWYFRQATRLGAGSDC